MVVASVPNFEEAYFGESVEDEKPYAALQKLQAEEEAFKHVADLLDALVSQDASKLPKNAVAYSKVEELRAFFPEPAAEV